MVTKFIVIDVERPDDFRVNVIIGMSHFIKTVEDIYEALLNVNPTIKFGLAFCEASGSRLIRTTGTDKEMIGFATRNAKKIAAGHSFVLFLNNTFPVSILGVLKNVPEVCHIFCATSNPLQILVGTTDQGNGIVGVVDGGSPYGVEGVNDIIKRYELLRELGYKFDPKKEGS